MDKAKHRRRGRNLSTRLARARVQEVDAIRLTDQLHTLTEWMPHDILDLVGPDTSTRQALYDFVMECLQCREVLDANRLRPVRQTLVNQRDALLAFATRLDQDLLSLARRLAVPVARRRELLVLQTLPTTTPAYGQRAGERHRALQGQFHPLQQALLERRGRLHRASSRVENCNSRRRNYCFLRRQIGPRYLDLLRFFLNHHPFKRRQQPHRVGKTPAELLTGQAHPHWLDMLGFTRFQRASQIA
jgi:hypothetical protein